MCFLSRLKIRWFGSKYILFYQQSSLGILMNIWKCMDLCMCLPICGIIFLCTHPVLAVLWCPSRGVAAPLSMSALTALTGLWLCALRSHLDFTFAALPLNWLAHGHPAERQGDLGLIWGKKMPTNVRCFGLTMMLHAIHPPGSHHL